MKVTLSGKQHWPEHLRVLVGGFSGSGKSRFASTFPNPLVANCLGEGGYTNWAFSPGTPLVDIESEADMITFRELALNGIGSYKVETLVIDSVDELQRKLLLERLAAEGRIETKIEDWGWLANRLNAIFTNLSQQPFNLVILCRKNIETNGLALQGQFAASVHNYVDYAFESTLDPDLSKEEAQAVMDQLADDSQPFPDIDMKYVLTAGPTIAWTYSKVDNEKFKLVLNADYSDLKSLHLSAVDIMEETVSSHGTVIQDLDEAREILKEIFEDDFSDLAKLD